VLLYYASIVSKSAAHKDAYAQNAKNGEEPCRYTIPI